LIEASCPPSGSGVGAHAGFQYERVVSSRSFQSAPLFPVGAGARSTMRSLASGGSRICRRARLAPSATRDLHSCSRVFARWCGSRDRVCPIPVVPEPVVSPSGMPPLVAERERGRRPTGRVRQLLMAAIDWSFTLCAARSPPRRPLDLGPTPRPSPRCVNGSWSTSIVRPKHAAAAAAPSQLQRHQP
jgi:hypothetical protein